ncbi:hypothetical protein NONO_c73840 [Nocardia nova SH22a]|uniref:Integrase SAM-like N-terminal domain-containing protein n=1 Tax=Nocardia nova SH22a TaxID=1415166 RepID=W5TSI9_9NOCA|nr:N-terminal phage integrase SAM-like domain-containing protein [Nocardia nova]AHH22139.1 hypothetical protein NONO_c73840 [Nocardia nova SH22a]
MPSAGTCAWILLTTVHTYKSYLECHLLPFFGETPLNRIDADAIAGWQRRELLAGHERSSITQWRGLLHTVLEDACVVDKLITVNPATKRRGRGRRTSRVPSRRPSGSLITGLQALLVAERMALPSGRDDEFVWEITKRYTGMRSGEIHGLETRYLINTGHATRRRLRVDDLLAHWLPPAQCPLRPQGHPLPRFPPPRRGTDLLQKAGEISDMRHGLTRDTSVFVKPCLDDRWVGLWLCVFRPGSWFASTGRPGVF